MARPKPTAEQKLANFWSYVEKPIDPFACWTWTGFRMPSGYGLVSYRDPHVGRLGHRFAYNALVGRIPVGIEVCHHCDNPPCVRPDHLFLGTEADNKADMVAKNRQARGAQLSHRRHWMKLTPAVIEEIRQRLTEAPRHAYKQWNALPTGFVAALAAEYGVTGVRIYQIGRTIQ